LTSPTSILITGAASGIGSALAHAYAASGIHLFLGDKNAAMLETVCVSCRNLGAVASGRALDVRDRTAMEQWIAEVDAIRPLDLVIANAGISRGHLAKEETADDIRAVFAVNIDGMLNTVLPVLPLLRSRKRGQIALMSSLAGIWGFPHAPSYSATKAAVRVFGQGLRARVAREGVSVSVIIPAFVRTPMTNINRFHMPWRIEADQAARIIQRKLARSKPEFVFPHPYTAVARIISALPPSLISAFLKLR